MPIIIDLYFWYCNPDEPLLVFDIPDPLRHLGAGPFPPYISSLPRFWDGERLSTLTLYCPWSSPILVLSLYKVASRVNSYWLLNSFHRCLIACLPPRSPGARVDLAGVLFFPLAGVVRAELNAALVLLIPHHGGPLWCCSFE
jgi:hypothetical protein